MKLKNNKGQHRSTIVLPEKDNRATIIERGKGIRYKYGQKICSSKELKDFLVKQIGEILKTHEMTGTLMENEKFNLQIVLEKCSYEVSIKRNSE